MPEFNEIWQGCTKYRLNQIMQANSIDEFLKKWPQYKTASGFKLVNQIELQQPKLRFKKTIFFCRRLIWTIGERLGAGICY